MTCLKNKILSHSNICWLVQTKLRLVISRSVDVRAISYHYGGILTLQDMPFSLQNASHPLDLGAVTDLNIRNAGQPPVKGRFPLKPDRLLKATFTFPQPLDVASTTLQSKLHVFTQMINDHHVRIPPQVRQ